MSDTVEGQRISLMWALICMAASLAVAIVFNEAVMPGHGKAVFLGVFVTAFITKTFQKSLGNGSVVALLIGVAAFHVLLVFVSPDDNRYPGALLFPLGLIDIAIFYYLFGLVARRA